LKYAILADIHANLLALEAVLADILARGGVDEYWCLGDIVGYGPNPSECIEIAQTYEFLSIAGNHDWAAIGKIDIQEFNLEAAAAIRWTRKQLKQEDIRFLENLPQRIEKDNFTLAHGSPREPIWEYILSSFTAEENLRYFKTSYCLVGHSHLPLLFECNDHCSFSEILPGTEIYLGDKRLIINPGSVGQPRDNDPRASYTLCNNNLRTVTLYRVEYDLRGVQAKMIQAGLPERLISRLTNGT
jgi:predicted phosphodiesterase